MGLKRHLTYDTLTGQVYSTVRFEDSTEIYGVASKLDDIEILFFRTYVICFCNGKILVESY